MKIPTENTSRDIRLGSEPVASARCRSPGLAKYWGRLDLARKQPTILCNYYNPNNPGRSAVSNYFERISNIFSIVDLLCGHVRFSQVTDSLSRPEYFDLG